MWHHLHSKQKLQSMILPSFRRTWTWNFTGCECCLLTTSRSANPQYLGLLHSFIYVYALYLHHLIITYQCAICFLVPSFHKLMVQIPVLSSISTTFKKQWSSKPMSYWESMWSWMTIFPNFTISYCFKKTISGALGISAQKCQMPQSLVFQLKFCSPGSHTSFSPLIQALPTSWPSLLKEPFTCCGSKLWSTDGMLENAAWFHMCRSTL